MLTDLEKDAIRHHYQTLATALPGFKPRPSQRRMIAEIANALSRCKERDGDELPEREGESILAVEGPTGVGKSVAYLIAGGVMAKNRAKKLIVSSATVALQEQLVNRDLPFVVEHSELPLTYALAKGRGRYACPYRLFQLTADSTQGELLRPIRPPHCGSASRRLPSWRQSRRWPTRSTTRPGTGIATITRK